ncbi:hypothetical protein CPB85DRAFT_1562181 [Mucidula mucida]|nr:hypothetical protein CPB85DRAFT_1562181 [Mucidula mucida]
MLFKASFVAAAATLLLPSLAPPLRREIKLTRTLASPIASTSGLQWRAQNCLDTLNSTGSADLWSVPTCVAGVTCDGGNLLVLAQCQNPEVTVTGAPHLNYDIYASIVGDCAWQDGGCPITFQNYVDFLYSQLTAVGSTDWPSSVDAVKAKWWTPIAVWTATGETIPYTNFDDWLHYAFTGTS